MQANISTLTNLQAINDNRTGAISDVSVFNETVDYDSPNFEELLKTLIGISSKHHSFIDVPPTVRVAEMVEYNEEGEEMDVASIMICKGLNGGFYVVKTDPYPIQIETTRFNSVKQVEKWVTENWNYDFEQWYDR
jgi:hypothetical protein